MDMLLASTCTSITFLCLPLQLISFYKNPYPWDIERSPFIQPHVLSLKFTTAENQSIAVRNLSKDIEIFLSNKDQAIPSPLKTSNDGPELLLYNFKVEVSHFKETLLLDVKRRNRSIPGIKFFIRFGKQVSRSEFDFYHHLPDSCTSCNGRPVHITESTVLIREPEKLEEGSGEVSIGILPFLHDEMSTQSFNSSAQGYDVRVMTVSCRFWNKSAWMEDGCKVGNERGRDNEGQERNERLDGDEVRESERKRKRRD